MEVNNERIYDNVPRDDNVYENLPMVEMKNAEPDNRKGSKVAERVKLFNQNPIQFGRLHETTSLIRPKEPQFLQKTASIQTNNTDPNKYRNKKETNTKHFGEGSNGYTRNQEIHYATYDVPNSTKRSLLQAQPEPIYENETLMTEGRDLKSRNIRASSRSESNNSLDSYSSWESSIHYELPQTPDEANSTAVALCAENIRKNIIVNMLYATLVHFTISNIRYWVFAYLFYILAIFTVKYLEPQITLEKSTLLFAFTSLWQVSFLVIIIFTYSDLLITFLDTKFLLALSPFGCILIALVIYKVIFKLTKFHDYITCENLAKFNDIGLIVSSCIFLSICVSFEFFEASQEVIYILFSIMFTITLINVVYILGTLFKKAQCTVKFTLTAIIGIISFMLALFFISYSLLFKIWLTHLS